MASLSLGERAKLKTDEDFLVNRVGIAINHLRQNEDTEHQMRRLLSQAALFARYNRR